MTHYKLRGVEFKKFGEEIGVDRSSAYNLVKLWPHWTAVWRRCRVESAAAVQRGESYSYPGWKTALEWFEKSKQREKPKTLADAMHKIEQIEAENARLKDRVSSRVVWQDGTRIGPGT